MMKDDIVQFGIVGFNPLDFKGNYSRRRHFWHATHDCVAPYVDIIFHRGRF